MSKVFKSVGKVFSKVGKAAAKIVPAVLAVGATVFTAGAALGLPAMAGGWGGAVSSVFGSSAIGNVLSGAVTQAGYGAAIGGILGGGEGATMGALGGAVGGGLMAGMGYGTDMLAGAFGQAPPAAGGPPTTGPIQGRVNQGFGAAASGGTGAVSPAAVAQSASGQGFAPPATQTAAIPQTVATTPGTGLGGFVERNQGLIGQTLAGLGGGLMQGMAARDAAKAEQARFNSIRDSYSVDDSALLSSGYQPDMTPRPSPAEAYGRAPNRDTRRFAFNPASGRIDWT